MRFKNQMLLKGVRNKFFLNTVENNYGATPTNNSNDDRKHHNQNKIVLATSDNKPLNKRELSNIKTHGNLYVN